MVSSFRTPTGRPGRTGPGSLVAPTASIVPADVRVDGRVVFTNIANGEAATTQVQARAAPGDAGPHRARGPAVLGPVDVAVARAR